MRKWGFIVLCVVLGLVPACGGSLKSFRLAQQTHDYLALAQDEEATLCWGLPNVTAAIGANVTRNHCTTQVAATVGLTDAKHQQFNAQFEKALTLHKNATTVLASGAAKADLADLKAAILALRDLAKALVATNETVASLQLHLQKASQ
jgi:hypothetical protein